MAYNQWNETDGEFKKVEGARAHVETRVWALLGAVESGVKALAAAVAAFASSVFNGINDAWGKNSALYKDVAVTQFNSFWRCALAVYSPDKAFASTQDADDNWLIGAEGPAWGTKYDPNTSTLVDKAYGWTFNAAWKPKTV
jgi:hypothetical protein